MEKPAPHVSSGDSLSGGSQENIRSKTLADSNEERVQIEPVPTSAVNGPGHAHISGVGLSANSLDLHKDPSYEELPSNEKEILQQQIGVPEVASGYWTLFRFAGPLEWTVFSASCVCAVAAGAAMPLMTVIFGRLSGFFADYFNGKVSFSSFEHQLSHLVLYYLYLAIASFSSVYISTVGFIHVGEVCTARIRDQYLKALLRQNIAFFDHLGAGEVTTRITADTFLIQDGISEKFGLALTAGSTLISAFAVAFARSWKLTLVLTSTVVAIILSIGIGSSFMMKWSIQAQIRYAKSGSTAEEVLSSIHNVTAFNSQEKLSKWYDEYLRDAGKFGRRHQGALGIITGLMMFVIFLSYGLAFWQGSRFLVRDEITVSRLLTVVFAVMIGASSIGSLAPSIAAFTKAAAVGRKIFATIERVSPIDPFSEGGKILENVQGTIELRNVRHIYPSRPDHLVLDNFSLLFPAGKTTALVGPSGSGKSTIVGLIERFYNPVAGEVLLDSVNVQDVNVRHLRQQLALVQQEPILFATTIYENIRFGLTNVEHIDVAKEKELVVNAAETANAHDFISALPNGYQTNVGRGGLLLSGGQKQRIAIARAVVGNPKILLLDEATSALDSASEKAVQVALDRAAKGRTTIVIAHRLSTIKNADDIVVMVKGQIVDQGTHDQLIEKNGIYATLVRGQNISAPQDSQNWTDQEEIDLKKAIDMEKNSPWTPGKSVAGKKLNDMELDPEKGSVNGSLWRSARLIWDFNKKEWPLMLLGLFFSAVAGGGQPVQAVLFAKSIQTLSLPPPSYQKLRQDMNFWCLMYLMLAFVQLVANLGYGIIFGYSQERLTHRARLQLFNTLLRQDIAFFDLDENSPGALTSLLSTSVIHLAGLSGTTIGTIFSVLTTLIASVSLSVAIGWKLALICTSTIPVLLICGFLRYSMLAEFHARSQAAYQASAAYACEATSAIRTVASLTREPLIWDEYQTQLEAQTRKSLISVSRSAVLFASSQSFNFLCVALGFWYGGTLIAKREYSLFQFFVCFMAIIFGAQTAGTIFSFAPDMGRAKHAAVILNRLFRRNPPIDVWSKRGDLFENVRGDVELRDVHFHYSNRPNHPVLCGIDLAVKSGQTAALVGPSGCGKSTIIALLERFYDPVSGSICVDGRDISKLRIKDYRDHLALVSQEPTLYEGTIRENILLGMDEVVSQADVECAAKEANIYDFIISLPSGFETPCGSKGLLLSGGQRQRIAIARALIRRPKVLLLDEATSALDTESERVVQEALDTAAHGRTTIVVAHRLHTIQRADIIYVIDGGKVVEKGRHAELMAKSGIYAQLVALQSLEKTT